MDRNEKQQLVANLRQALEESSLVVVTRQSGLTVSEVSDLRSKMREAEASYKVAKNKLAKIAIKDTSCAQLEDFMTGPTALAYSKDPVAAAKVAVNFSNDNDKLSVIGGILNGELLDEAAVKNLAKLPSLDELRGKLIGVISAPAQKIASVLAAPGAQVARVISAKSQA